MRHSMRQGTPSLRVAATALVLALLASALLACADEDLDASAPSGAGGAAIGPGLTVAQARSSRLREPLLVNGYVHVEGARVRLCEALAESFPPQCAGPSIEVRGLDLAGLSLESGGNVRWSAQPRQILGVVRDGVLTVSGTSQS